MKGFLERGAGRRPSHPGVTRGGAGPDVAGSFHPTGGAPRGRSVGGSPPSKRRGRAGAPSARVEGGRVRCGPRRGAQNQGFLGPSAAPPSGGECGCARRVPVSGEPRAGCGPRERASEQAAEQQPGGGGGGGGDGGGGGRSAPRLPGLASLAAAPRPDLPPPPPGPDLGSAPRSGCQRHPPSGIRERSAGRRDPGASVRRRRQQTGPGEPPSLGPEPLGSRPGAVPSAPPPEPESQRSPAEALAERARAHQALRSATAPRGSTQVPRPRGPAISSGRRGEGTRRAGGLLHPPPRGIGSQARRAGGDPPHREDSSLQLSPAHRERAAATTAEASAGFPSPPTPSLPLLGPLYWSGPPGTEQLTFP
ncbi:translation initiation factor IF-2-like [Phodopus roborovskii]|uniref:translation initiation factor IF-2-like n=1 Tax=Phodopus roborovskii TaxID=109678 RepID=UPI0021E37852|nr:translation initiation factor IF-2-like [Phodopus roborovskii]